MKLACALFVVAASAATAVHATGLADENCIYLPVDCELYTILTDTSPWGACELDAASGSYYRYKVLGIKKEAVGTGLACPSETDPRRRVREQCRPGDCVAKTPAEDTDPFGPCTDDGTGKFYRSKILGIKTPATNGGRCDEKDRVYKELCDAVNCVVNTEAEDTGAFGECLQDGSTNVYYQYKVLKVKTLESNGGTCPSEEARTVKKLCPAENCVPVDISEDTGDYSTCYLKDGKYIKSKVLKVKTDAKNGGTCNEEDRTVTAPCAAVDCELNTFDEEPNQFGECLNNGTNVFFQYRLRGIKTQPLYGGAPCPAEADRTDSKLCPAEDCIPNTPEEDKEPFGDCTAADDYSNVYYRYKVLGVKIKEKFGGKCEPADRTIRELCPAVNCELLSESEDTGEFGECKNNGTNVFFQYRVRGVKTEPLYGGTPCPTVTDSKLCPAEDCIPVPKEKDTKPFGNCTQDGSSNVYYKYKVLDVETPEKNGGKCEEADRTIRELCPAVNCVVNTPAEETNAFGPCTQKDYSDKYYRYRVLQVKTKEQYGGTCPSEAERTEEKECPNDGFCVPSDPFYEICIPKLAQCSAQERLVYKGFTLNEISGLALWECCDKCTNTSGCAAYSYYTNNATCLLKWEARDYDVGASVVIYSSKPKSPKPTQCQYTDNARMTVTPLTKTLAEITTNDLDLCCQRCVADAQCKAFEHTGGVCTLVDGYLNITESDFNSKYRVGTPA